MNRKGKRIFSSAAAVFSALLFCGSANAGQGRLTETDTRSKSQTVREEIGEENAASKIAGFPELNGLRQAILDYLEQDGYEQTNSPMETYADRTEQTESERETETRLETGSETDKETQAETETSSETKKEIQTGTEAGSEIERETERMTETESETETETEPQPVSRTASASGYEDGLVYVMVTLDPDGTIADVEITDCSSQTDTIGQIAAPAVARQIEKAQSVQVDGVTGATYTSDAVKAAAEKAIREAKRALRNSSNTDAASR